MDLLGHRPSLSALLNFSTTLCRKFKGVFSRKPQHDLGALSVFWPMNVSQNRLALVIGVAPRRINEIVLGKRIITADTALRLGRYFGMSPQFWLGLQMDYDLDVTADRLEKRLEKEVKPRATAV